MQGKNVRAPGGLGHFHFKIAPWPQIKNLSFHAAGPSSLRQNKVTAGDKETWCGYPAVVAPGLTLSHHASQPEA